MIKTLKLARGRSWPQALLTRDCALFLECIYYRFYHHSCFFSRFSWIFTNSFHAGRESGTMTNRAYSVYLMSVRTSRIDDTTIKSNTIEKDAKVLHALMNSRHIDVSIWRLLRYVCLKGFLRASWIANIIKTGHSNTDLYMVFKMKVFKAATSRFL